MTGSKAIALHMGFNKRVIFLFVIIIKTDIIKNLENTREHIGKEISLIDRICNLTILRIVKNGVIQF